MNTKTLITSGPKTGGLTGCQSRSYLISDPGRKNFSYLINTNRLVFKYEKNIIYQLVDKFALRNIHHELTELINKRPLTNKDL